VSALAVALVLRVLWRGPEHVPGRHEPDNIVGLICLLSYWIYPKYGYWLLNLNIL